MNDRKQDERYNQTTNHVPCVNGGLPISQPLSFPTDRKEAMPRDLGPSTWGRRNHCIDHVTPYMADSRILWEFVEPARRKDGKEETKSGTNSIGLG